MSISERSIKVMNTILNEVKMFGVIVKYAPVLRTVLVVVLFSIGAYLTYRTPSRATLPEGFINIESDAQVGRKLRMTTATTTTTSNGDAAGAQGAKKEGFDGATPSPPPPPPPSAPSFESTNSQRCPNILIQHGNEIFLYNSKVEKVPGVNPIRFKSLEDYSEFMDWLQGRGIRCPILFLQFSYDAQGNAVYKMRPSPVDLQGGLSPNVPYSPAPAALVQMMDASRDNPPFNNQMYDGFDPLNFNMGDYTTQDADFRAKELTMKYSDNPMDANWGGKQYSESVVDSGAYIERTRPDAIRSDTSALVPMRVPSANEKYRNPMYAGDAVSRGRGADVQWGKMRQPA
jgi:hypothetical protein